MHWYARQLGFCMSEDFWGWLGCCTMSILKHTRRSTVKGAELLAEIHAEDTLIHAVCSHGYGLVRCGARA